MATPLGCASLVWAAGLWRLDRLGRIHPEAEYTYLSRDPECAEIVRPFLTCFDVTRGFTKSGLECFYLRGEPCIAELIGLERDLFLGYAPSPEFQARTIKLHDQIVREDRTRLDPVGTIIISDDPKTRDKFHEYLLSEPERPPIVALSVEELRAISNTNDIRRVFIDQLFRRDLFALTGDFKSRIPAFACLFSGIT